jgi:Icc-related predicted phosphoesterase
MGGLTILYAADFHGSEVVWRKFINAAPFYKADVLVMGGDLCGKGIVPIVSRGGGTYDASFMGPRRVYRDENEVAQLENDIRFNGLYPYRCSPDEVAQASADPRVVDALFDRLIHETFEHWLGIADEKLARSRVPCYVMPGNDDSWVVDESFGEGHLVQNCDGRTIELPGGYTLSSCGYSNRTPWDTARELGEEDLEGMIEKLVGQVSDQRRAIFNLHVPPHNSELDTAPLLDADLRPKREAGQQVMVPVGSTAVLKIIERYQPLLGLHGHIHESRGFCRIGRTLCINPGSFYNLGRLDGVLVRLDGERVKGFQFVSG